MEEVQLVVGARQIDRLVSNPVDLLRQYRKDIGCYYVDYQSTVSLDVVVPEDLAVTLLINSRAGYRAFLSLQERGSSIDLKSLPQKPLAQTTPEERWIVRDVIAKMAAWPGFAASLATKVLHKKRPDLIPILDNQAIFGAYMNKNWPTKLARSDSIRDGAMILQALDYIAFDLNREENHPAWRRLQVVEPKRTLIQLFDGVWWMYFRLNQPVSSTSGSLRVG